MGPGPQACRGGNQGGPEIQTLFLSLVESHVCLGFLNPSFPQVLRYASQGVTLCDWDLERKGYFFVAVVFPPPPLLGRDILRGYDI